jgi:hypothetical protein
MSGRSDILMKQWLQLIFPVLLGSALAAQAQLVVTVGEPKSVGHKAAVKLTMKNTFNENIESARATLFLMAEEGKVIGQSTQWVIGGNQDRPGLEAGATNVFHFVITPSIPASFSVTNLNVKVVFTRLLLESDKSLDPIRNVQVEEGGR